MTYINTLKRIRQHKTNYHKRAAILIGRHSFVTIKVTDQNVTAQILKPTATGDLVITSAHSRELTKQGWKGSANSLPACYLTGLLLGKKGLEKGVTKAVLYIGKQTFTTRVAACLKGIVESGVQMPVSEESLPPEERISGEHIAEYATSLKEDSEQYKSRFSQILKNGLSPEDYPSHFEEIKSKISGKPITAKKEEAEEEEGAEDKEAGSTEVAKPAKAKAEKPKKEEAKKKADKADKETKKSKSSKGKDTGKGKKSSAKGGKK